MLADKDVQATVAVKSLDAAKRFYEGALGLKRTGGNETGALRDAMRTSIDRAHRNGLQVIGHSVEEPQAAATLWMSGIDFIQGNLVQQAASELDFDFKNAVL